MSSLPFTGSKISLISKSDIRYVGTLHSINQQESTVSLEQVRSYGTEGRKKDKSEEISGTDQIYEYIVFRGSDIKDLQVCEAPPPPTRPQVQVPKDPAILGTTAPSTIPPGFPMMQGLDGNMLPPNLQMPVNPYLIQMYQQQLWQQQMQQQQQPAAALLKSNETTPSTNPASNIISAMENLTINKETEKKSTNKSKEETTQPPKTNNESSTNENAQQNGEKSNNNNRNQNNNNANSNQANHNRNYNQNNRFQRGGRQNNYRRGMNTRGGRRNWNNSKQIPLPDSDFDFESANAKFKELSNKEGDKPANEVKKEQTESINSPEVELPKENGTEEKATGDFYNKSSSFFDNISCESKERIEEQGKKFDRRAKQYEERKLNMETFGQATVNRGGHRGYRRNNYHSYRGGRNNYNRNGGYHRNSNGYRNNNYYNNNNRQKNQEQPQQNQNNQQQKQEATTTQ